MELRPIRYEKEPSDHLLKDFVSMSLSNVSKTKISKNFVIRKLTCTHRNGSSSAAWGAKDKTGKWALERWSPEISDCREFWNFTEIKMVIKSTLLKKLELCLPCQNIWTSQKVNDVTFYDVTKLNFENFRLFCDLKVNPYLRIFGNVTESNFWKKA